MKPRNPAANCARLGAASPPGSAVLFFQLCPTPVHTTPRRCLKLVEID
jgi:hypothetical protein